ncbi:MAG TPA: galactokinase family protein [Thermoleophilaceae bacterium]|nr:galactokinase family protein [Thermoleophilaceae bacterium]
MSSAAVRAFAPGRVNLIGEHTDYNDGLCLPFAIERGVTVTARPRDGADIEARALDLCQDDRFSLCDEIRPPHPGRAGAPHGWTRFVRGAAAELTRAGLEPRPCVLEIHGDVPRGAGLSSSAALSVALCLALCTVAAREPPATVELARLCSRMENDWCGAQTGLLDPLASLLGRRQHAVRLDMRELTWTHVELDLGEHVLATLDSGASRTLAESGYNERREECRRAAAALGVESLRDARSGTDLPEPLGRRVRHVLSENRRVDDAVSALRDRDPHALGALLDASHASLRDDYEVSTPDVERTVERCKRAGALGARIVGGGFGGSVLGLFPPGAELPDRAVSVAPGPRARLL